MSKKEQEKMLDPTVAKAVNAFLFGEPEADMEKALSARTIIKDKETFRHVYFHRLLEKYKGSKAAKDTADVTCQMLISVEGIGREQGVNVITQHKSAGKEQIVKGTEEMVEEE